MFFDCTAVNQRQDSFHSPRRIFGPVTHRFGGPGAGLIGMASGAGIWNFVFVGHGGIDEGEAVSADFRVGDGGFDLRHVAGDALAARGILLVMCVLFESSCARAVRG